MFSIPFEGKWIALATHSKCLLLFLKLNNKANGRCKRCIAVYKAHRYGIAAVYFYRLTIGSGKTGIVLIPFKGVAIRF